MSISSTFVPEFDEEMKITRRLLERVPDDKASWKPHPKSFSMAHLSQLVARMPGWITQMMRETRLDLSAAPAYSNETTKSLVAEFDRHVSEARAALGARDEDFMVPWSLASGERVELHATGAYVTTYASQRFNGFAPLAEYYI